MKRVLAFLPLVLLIALAALFIGWSLKRDPQFKPDALVGKPLPPAEVTPLAGGIPVPLTAVVRGPALVNVFASWCAPCREENAELLRLQARGVRIIGLAWKDQPDATRAFLADLGDPFVAVVGDQDGSSGVDLGISGVPETFAVDARGRVVAKHTGPLLPGDAERLLAALQASAR
ncbi:MAG: DsbE family thiol:disulfide interchange protein [Caulobacteraceae bacterium]|nr:DsbE family thiol:disulfide interchange protein [Caulobacteraceae bacterium]